MLRLPVAGPLADPPISSYPYLLRPSAVHVRLSAKCDSNCMYCERESWKSGDKAPEQDMPVSVWESVRDNMVPHVEGVEVVGLGEPTLAKLFPQVCRDVIAAGKVLYFATNGHFLSKKRVLDCVGDAPRVSISFDAATPETYIAIGRGVSGDFEKTLAAVRAFRAAKPGAFLHSQFTAGAYNIDELPAFIDVAADIGIEEVLMRWVQDHTLPREDVSLRFHRDRTEAALAAARVRAKERGIRFMSESHEYSPTQPNAGFGPMSMSPDSRAARYLDYVPMTDMTCTTVDTSTYTTDTLSVTSGTGSTVICSYDPFIGYVSCTTYISGTTYYDGGTTVVSGTTTVCVDFYPCTTYFGTTVIGTGTTPTVAPSSSNPSNGFAAFAVDESGGPEIFTAAAASVSDPVPLVLQSRRQQSERGYDSPSVADDTPDQEVRAAPTALIVDYTGDCWTCFARHSVGNVLTDTFDAIIRNPSYQRWLQNRAGVGSPFSDPWCFHCARTF